MSKIEILKISILISSFAIITGCGKEQQNSTTGQNKTAESNLIITELKSEDEFKAILSNNKIVLVDFYADWCPPCKVLKPTINEIARNYPDNVTVMAVNIDQFGKIASGFNIRSIPTVNIFHSNKLEASFVGVRPMSDYTRILDQLLTKKL